MKTLTLALTLAGAGSVFAAEPLPLIPLPSVVERADGHFEFSGQTGIRYHQTLATEAGLFAKDLEKLTGDVPMMATKEQRSFIASEILLDVDASADLPPSGYQLEISPKAIRIIGKDAAGAWYGTRTLLQLLPTGKITTADLDGLHITDHPRFGWRGMMLDVGRHFYPVENIKSLIDWMAFHKLNTFHWHLTEDQGWRIEIKKYPKLTEVGAFRESSPPYGDRNGSDGKRYGGFYTQEQIREVVAYASARHITIVPEIDMPGHMAAAIAAYPELGNSDIPNYDPKVVTHWGVYPYTLAPTEEVFRFVDDVFTEVCDLFPSPYIHMGGDEAPKTQWEQSPRVKELMQEKGFKDAHDVQSYFVKRVEKILEAKGRKLIGWDEIREGGLSPKATVMSWRGEDGGIASAKEGHDVVMTPTSHLYIDYYQTPAAQELAKGIDHEAIGGLVTLEKVYSYNPVPTDLTKDEARHILGAQANLWTEYIKDYKKVEYFAFPRMAALAEIVWTQPERKDYYDFLIRLKGVMNHYDAAGVRHGEIYMPPVRQANEGATVETSLGIHGEHWQELAFDGRDDTFFWASEALEEGDHLTLRLKEPIAIARSVSVATGGPASRNGDRLEQGVIEASTDGKEWQPIGTFENGKAAGTLAVGTSMVRIRVTAPQSNWLIVHEINLR
ncbi:MAG: family 20 glycosylhydrolase [Verrucomicrobiota bacterium]